MCTAIKFATSDHYFGRNLDLECSYNETVTIVPRQFPLDFYCGENPTSHYAMIGMATVVDGYPLLYDATNEFGLSMAGLNFPGNAVYLKESPNLTNICPYEFIPWVLANCKTVSEVREKLQHVNLVDVQFSDTIPLTPLHWMISDKKDSIVVEPRAEGIQIFENPVGVLTNNPPFDFHMYNLANFINLTREEPSNRFSTKLELLPYSRGMGGIGLPGDLSSSSRFIKAAFTKLNALCDKNDDSSISQFFHILSSVEQQRGCVRVGDKYEVTVYSSCCNTDKGIYYYRTYDNSQISAINMHHENLNTNELVLFPLIKTQQINLLN